VVRVVRCDLGVAARCAGRPAKLAGGRGAPVGAAVVPEGGTEPWVVLIYVKVLP